MTIEGELGRLRVGDIHPVRLMGIINLSAESFYRGSVSTPESAASFAMRMVDEGAEVIDVGAVSTAPGSPFISEDVERERLFPALENIMDNVDVEVSVDTQRASIADLALSRGASCINDVSCLNDPSMARVVAEHDASLLLMASRERPGDLLELKDIVPRLAAAVSTAVESGVDQKKILIDPGIGRWIPEKTYEYDLAILDGMRSLRSLRKPVVAAVSRKSFIGAVLDLKDPAERLTGSIAATAIAVYNGAHVVRTHDVAVCRDAIRIAQAARGGLRRSGRVELLSTTGSAEELRCILDWVGVDPGAHDILWKKGSFLAIAVDGITPMEALVIKQEMLAAGGDAAVPRGALRCDPSADRAVIFGTLAQIERLLGKLRLQPFCLPSIASEIESVLHTDASRYRLAGNTASGQQRKG
ncbi:MAG: dihydropteroate synthase [Methanothrix sp.]|uniref:dihydropteroate synthase n=1 Tax=Methanothrix sp. TaxID=90426 RepID=UPI0032AEDB77|nr:dihydropteroate synthase [Methanothrix sp.]